VFEEARDEARAEAKQKGRDFLDEDVDLFEEVLGDESAESVEKVKEYLSDDFMSAEKVQAEGDDEELLKLLGLETEPEKEKDLRALFDEDLGPAATTTTGGGKLGLATAVDSVVGG